MNSNTENIEKALHDINPSKSSRSKILKLIGTIGIWIIFASAAIFDAVLFYKTIYGKLIFWALILLFIIRILYFISRIMDLIHYRKGVRISTKHSDKDLISFKNLYNRRILNNSTTLSPYETPAEDIIKWAKEPDNSTYINRFPFAKKDSELFGFIFATYYFKSKLSFISYLVINDEIKEARKIDSQDRVVAQLFGFQNKQFKQIQGVVAEVEYDNDSSNERSNKKVRDFKALSRIFGYKLWALWGVPSKEPDPSPQTSSPNNERPIVLLYIRTKNNPKFNSNESPTKVEIENILKFVYLNVYYDSHIDDDKLCKKYRTYLDDLYKRVWMEYESKQLNQSIPNPSTRGT
jgi:hypothetical protein